MNLIQFQKIFQTEEACHQHLYKLMWPEGFHCPKCQLVNAVTFLGSYHGMPPIGIFAYSLLTLRV
ncbi:transposase (plasmid) [Paenibacillus cellulosilyticus]|nr:transposase [Paenibacillus cellulosilyticus]